MKIVLTVLYFFVPRQVIINDKITPHDTTENSIKSLDACNVTVSYFSLYFDIQRGSKGILIVGGRFPRLSAPFCFEKYGYFSGRSFFSPVSFLESDYDVLVLTHRKNKWPMVS